VHTSERSEKNAEAVGAYFCAEGVQ
jgi:hypothetical protein